MADPNSSPSMLNIALAAAALLVTTGVGLYAYYFVNDNPAEQQACSNTGKKIEALSSAIKGELAAFQPVDNSIPLSNLSFNNDNDVKKSLADFNGKTVLLNLWATWCAPCRREMPALQKLHDQMAGPDFAVVPVSVDIGNANKPKAFYQKTGLDTLPFYHDGSMQIFETLRKHSLAIGMPTTVLVDNEGCSLGVLNGPAEWASEDAIALIKAAL